MTFVSLSDTDLALEFLLLLFSSILSIFLRLGLERRIGIGTTSLMLAGVISLPGMMTGQILAGIDPTEAVKYQILIMFLIAGSTGMGTLVAVLLVVRRLSDDRHRLRLDRIADGPSDHR